MHRREYLGVGVLVSVLLAGCQRAVLRDSEPEPRYEEPDEEAMVLTLEAFPDGWNRRSPESDDWDAKFTPEDENREVLVSVDVFETIDDAEAAFEAVQHRYRPREYDLADEAFWGELADYAVTVLRHSNAVGTTAAGRRSGLRLVPDRIRAIDYAEALYERWQRL